MAICMADLIGLPAKRDGNSEVLATVLARFFGTSNELKMKRSEWGGAIRLWHQVQASE